MLRQDYIGRLIQQVAEALAGAAGLLEKRRLDEAEAEIAAAEGALGSSGMQRLDARSVALVLGGGDKVVLAAALVEKRAELALARGDAALAAELRARAAALLGHARPQELAGLAAELRARS